MKRRSTVVLFALLAFPAFGQVSSTGSLDLDGRDTLTAYGLELAPHAIPEIALATLPQDVAQTGGTTVSSTPSSDVVMNVVQSLRAIAQATDDIGLAWWRIVMLLASAGSLISFLFLCRDLGRGGAEPADLAVWAMRSGASFFVVAWLSGASPWIMINSINWVTTTVSGDTSKVVSNAEANSTSNYYAPLLSQQVRQASSIVAATEYPVPSAATAAQPALQQHAWTAVMNALGGARKIGQAQYIAGEDALTAWVREQYGLLGQDGVTDLTGDGSFTKNYKAVELATAAPPQFYQDAATGSWKSLSTVIYVYAIEMAITIWAMPISLGLWGSCMAWPQAAGLPKFWSLALKTFLTMILSTALASSFAFTALQTIAGSPQQNQGGYWSYLSSQMSRLGHGDIAGAASSWASEGTSLIASVTGNQWMSFLTGTAWQLRVVSALILASPVMAAAAVAGGSWAASAVASAKNNPSGGSSWGSFFGGHGNFDAGSGAAGSGTRQKSRKDMLGE